MTRFVGFHLHAYQPPRTDPILGAVPEQPSAAPFHDWNERVTAECYEPLARAQLGATTVNLWTRVGFDLGPTLGVWLAAHRPDVLAQVAAEPVGAIGHPWVHAILPLLHARQRHLALAWGRVAARSQLGVEVDGLWCPELAMGTPVLEDARDHGFTWVLCAPHQVSGPNATPGLRSILLPSDRTMGALVYDGELSHEVAFGALLQSGEHLGARILERARSAPDDSITVIAVDAETFGHHHKFAEMALAGAIAMIDATADVELVTPASYLATHPVEGSPSVQLVENTSWSCVHGIDRWRADCGCRFDPGTTQPWRAPLRDALTQLNESCERAWSSSPLSQDPASVQGWASVLCAVPEDRDHVLDQWLANLAAPDDRAMTWMRGEQLRLEAWTSCAWFFDSIDRVEPAQSLSQARVVSELYQHLGVPGLEPWWQRRAPISRPSEYSRDQSMIPAADSKEPREQRTPSPRGSQQ